MGAEKKKNHEGTKAQRDPQIAQIAQMMEGKEEAGASSREQQGAGKPAHSREKRTGAGTPVPRWGHEEKKKN